MKRKIISVLGVLMAVLIFCGCSNLSTDGAQTSTEAESSEQSALNESKNSSIIIPGEPEESKKEYVPSITPGKKASVQADFTDL